MTIHFKQLFTSADELSTYFEHKEATSVFVPSRACFKRYKTTSLY